MANWQLQVRVPGAGGSWTTISKRITGLRIEKEINQLWSLDVDVWAPTDAERTLLVEKNDARVLVDSVERWYGRVEKTDDDPFERNRHIQALGKLVVLRGKAWRGRKSVGGPSAQLAVDEAAFNPNGEPAEGLAVYLDMMQVAGTTIGDTPPGDLRHLDLSGNLNDLFLFTAPSTVAGKWNRVLRIASGSSAFVRHSSTIDITGAYSVSCWFDFGTITSSGAGNRLFFFWFKLADLQASSPGFAVYAEIPVSSTNVIFAVRHVAGGTIHQASTTGQAIAAGYHHILFTFDPTQPSLSRVKIYLDGVSQTVSETENMISPGTVPSQPGRIGQMSGLLTFACDIDEFYLYARTLASTEVPILRGIDVGLAGGGLYDTFGPGVFRAEQDDRLHLVESIAKVSGGELYVDRDGSDKDRLRFVSRIGSPTTVASLLTPALQIADQEMDLEGIGNDITVLGAGDGPAQLESRAFHATPVRQALTAAYSATSTGPMTFGSTTDYPTPGVVRLGKERILYTGKSSTQLGTTSVTRAYSGDGSASGSAYAHSVGIEAVLESDRSVTPPVFYSPATPNTASSIGRHGWRALPRHTDRAVSDQDTLDRLAQRFIALNIEPRESVVADYRSPTLAADLGDQVELYKSRVARPAGAIARWNMSTFTPDGKMADRIGTRHGTLVGTTDVAGKLGRARKFGTSDRIDAAAFSPTGLNMVVAGWFKWTTNPTPFYGGIHGGGSSWEIRVQNDGKFAAVFYQTEAITTEIASPLAYNDGNWHHAMAVLRAGLAEIWVDGVKVAEDTTSPITSLRASTGIQIGLVASNFNGDIDEVVLYDSAPTAAQLLDLYLSRPYENTPYRIVRIVFERDEPRWTLDLGNPRDTSEVVIAALKEDTHKTESYGQALATTPSATFDPTDITIVTTTEKLLATVTARGVKAGQKVAIIGIADINVGAATTELDLFIRRGTTVSDPVVGEGMGITGSPVPSGFHIMHVFVTDVALKDDPTYALTALQVNATGNGSSARQGIMVMPQVL